MDTQPNLMPKPAPVPLPVLLTVDSDKTGVAVPLWKRMLLLDILSGMWITFRYMFQPKI